MKDLLVDTSRSTGHLIKSDSCTTACIQEVTSRGCANNATSVQKAEVLEPGTGSWCTSVTSVHRSTGLPFTEHKPPDSERGNRYLLVAMATSPSGQREKPYLTERHRRWLMLRSTSSSAASGSRESYTVRGSEIGVSVYASVLQHLETSYGPAVCTRVRWVGGMTSLEDDVIKFLSAHREIETRGYPCSCLPTEYQGVRPQAQHTPKPWSGGSNMRSVTYCSVLPLQEAFYDRLCGGPHWSVYDMHDYTRQQLLLARDRMKAPYNRLSNSARLQEGDSVFCKVLPGPEESPKLQSSCEGPYHVITRINDVANQIQRHPRSTVMVLTRKVSPSLQTVANNAIYLHRSRNT
jgi:hypothetical protein